MTHLLSFGKRWIGRLVDLAHAHNIDPRVVIAMSILGWIVHLMTYLPWLRTPSAGLGLLITLRVMGLVVPAYILLKGRRIAAVLNVGLVASYTVHTAWHVCYYVFL
jgi:hypothetical protein